MKLSIFAKTFLLIFFLTIFSIAFTFPVSAASNDMSQREQAVKNKAADIRALNALIRAGDQELDATYVAGVISIAQSYREAMGTATTSAERAEINRAYSQGLHEIASQFVAGQKTLSKLNVEALREIINRYR